MKNVLKYHVGHDIKTIIYSSPDTVYGNTVTRTLDVNSNLQLPASTYGETKLICQQIVKETVRTSVDTPAKLLR